MKHLFKLLVYVIISSIVIIYIHNAFNGKYVRKKTIDEEKLSYLSKISKQHTKKDLWLQYLRHLYPQIWTCKSSSFVGKPGYYSQFHEDEVLHRWIFNNESENQNPGIFVEIGAQDGVSWSNTLFFERMFDWRGVLIEAQPDNAKKLITANRQRTVKLPVGICSPPQTHIRMLVSKNILYIYNS